MKTPDPAQLAQESLAAGHRIFTWRHGTDFTSGAFGRNAGAGPVPEVTDAIERIEWAGYRLFSTAFSPSTTGGRGDLVLIFEAARS